MKPAQDWATLTPDERLEVRMRLWESPPDVAFADDAAATAYRERVGIIRDALALRRPQRVPICPMFGVYPLAYSSVTVREAMYDYDRFAEAWFRFHADFGPDTVADPLPSGRVFETIDYAQYRWPGHGTGDDTGYQYVEAEYMLPGEYERLAARPHRVPAQRVPAADRRRLRPVRGLAPLLDLMEGPGVAVCLSQFGTPEMQGALRALLSAGAESIAWLEAVGATFVGTRLPARHAGLQRRHDQGAVRRPRRHLPRHPRHRPRQVPAAGAAEEALERLVPLCVEQGVAGGDAGGCPLIFIPLHKGADGFLSDADYRTLYWPTLKAVILGLIDEGLVPLLFAEGGFDQRLSVIADPEIPAGRTIWLFDTTDMVEARRALRGRACIGGNVPGTLLELGTPTDVDDYVRRLIEDVAGEGGFILSTGTDHR